MKGFFKKLSFLFSDECVLVSKISWTELSNRLARIDTDVSDANLRIANTAALLAGAPTKADFERVRELAMQAYDITVGIIPDSGIKAHSFDGAIVVTGLDKQAKG
jgi:hypothetical protein